MDKATLNIPAADGKWGSYISKYPPDSPTVGNSAFTAGTRNLITSASGQAEKRQGGILWNPASPLSGPALDQYEGVFSTGQRLFIVNDAGTLKASTGNGLFAPLVGGTGFTNPANFEFVTYQDRIYGDNAVDAPIVIDVAASYGGVSYPATPAKVRPMGAQAPVTAPVPGVPTAGGAVPAGSHTYKVTFVYYNGAEESNPGPASAVVAVTAPNQTVPLTAIPVGGYGVSWRNIYRDNNDGNYLLLDTILDNTTTTYSDHLVIGATPTPIPLLNFGPPLFRYCLLYLDRIFVIDVAGKTISWSLPGAPDVWYPQNAISGPPDDIMTGFGMLNGLPYVFGQHTVGTILGTTDSSFYYNSISTKVGCVDNRTIQARLIVSVPKLLWLAALPNRGIYYTNGSTVEHLSDNIQDLTFNLAQISYLSRLNSQTSQADFEAGTASPAIDLTTNPGAVETINPKASYSHAADWAAGDLSNIALSGDQLSVPVASAFSIGSGTLGGSAQISGSNVTLPGAGAAYSLSAPPDGGLHTWDGFSGEIWMPFVPTQSGTWNGYTVYSQAPTFQAGFSGGTLRADALGTPGASIPGSNLTGTFLIQQTPTFVHVGGTSTAVLTAGARYWMGIAATNVTRMGTTAGFPGSGAGPYFRANGGSTDSPSSFGFACGADILPVHGALSGTWASPVYDSLCTTESAGMAVVISATYPGSTSSSVVVQGSPDHSTWTTTDTLSSPNGTVSITGGQFRYWRITMTLSTSDNTNVPALGAPTLQFNVIGTWTSPAIHTTTDATAFNALVQSVMTPAGTSSVLEIATSASAGSGYSSYGPVGAAVPNAYAKIRVTLTASAGDVTSPTLVSAELDWTVVATFISSIVDTGQPPNGWGIFQYESTAPPGEIAAYFRTAASAGAIPAAIWAPITSGTFPTNTVYEFFQYKLVLTAMADAVPVVDAVTTTWLVTSGNNVRAASLFFNKSYYLAVATQGSTANNLLIEYDYQDNWRIHDGVRIGTMATYFNDIFYCDAQVGNVYNGFRSDTDNGTPIVMRLRTKCFDLGNNLQMKTARSLKITGVNTGTFLTISYSVDRGSTWNMMLNSLGTLGYQTAADGLQFIEYFVPVFDGSAQVSGRTIMYEILSSDQFPCAILQITPTVYVHKGKAVREAMVA